jgi:delta 1-pyrroline-5-carboxylate dehydrogenase
LEEKASRNPVQRRGTALPYRFASERTLTINTAATGGNAELLSLRDDEDIES